MSTANAVCGRIRSARARAPASPVSSSTVQAKVTRFFTADGSMARNAISSAVDPPRSSIERAAALPPASGMKRFGTVALCPAWIPSPCVSAALVVPKYSASAFNSGC